MNFKWRNEGGAIRYVRRLIPFLIIALNASSRCETVQLWGDPGRAAQEGKPGLKYAPDRVVDLLHLRLDVTPDFDRRTIRGVATLRFKPISRAVRSVTLDGVDLAVDSVSGEPAVSDTQVGAETITLTFEREIAPGEEAAVTIAYHAEPRQGLYFRTPELGYPETDSHLWTQGETHEARYWYPGIDYPNEKFTSEVICHVPKGMIVRSNGRLVSRESGADGLIAWHWLQDKPHPNYLVALAAGYFRGVESSYRDIPIAFWTVPSLTDRAPRAFGETADMLAFFEKEIGVPYPWAKYDQVAVSDFLYGGMENTSMTILTDRILIPGNVEDSTNVRNLVSHELAHQWFGDYVTCKDWSHAWLNEGFATYYAELFEGEKDGDETLRYRFRESADSIAEQKNDTTPIVRRDYRNTFDQFSFRAYQKGAWLLRMLRAELGDDAFQKGIRLYLEQHALGDAVTDDLLQALEAASGQSLDRFFDQWAYHGGIPELRVDYDWIGARNLAHIRVRQTQKFSREVLLFHIPLTVRFEDANGAREERLRIQAVDEDFYLPLKSAPDRVLVDPRQEILADISFNPGRTMLLATLQGAGDAVVRAEAAKALGGIDDHETVEALTTALKNDSFFGVRIQAARSLARMGTDEAAGALAAEWKQPDARVRRAVVEALAGLYGDAVKQSLLAVARDESNPVIRAAAVKGLGRYPGPEVATILRDQLQSDTYRQVVASAAMEAARMRDDLAFAEPIIQVLDSREPDFPNDAVADGLETLGYLARQKDDRGPVRKFLIERLEHPNRRIRIGALRGLGSLGDPAALPTVEAFDHGDDRDDLQKAAKAAAEKIKASEASNVQLEDIRKELGDLRRENAEIKKGMEKLRKQVEVGRDSAESEKSTVPRRRWLGIF